MLPVQNTVGDQGTTERQTQQPLPSTGQLGRETPATPTPTPGVSPTSIFAQATDTAGQATSLAAQLAATKAENAQLKSEVAELRGPEVSQEIKDMVAKIGQTAKAASQIIGTKDTAQQRTQALEYTADAILANKGAILEANAKDVAAARLKYPDQANGKPHPMVDRLQLNDTRISDMVNGLRKVASMKDPIGEEIKVLNPINSDLSLKRVRTPLGVIGVIYESRPNVTIDAGALCLKAGNAVILRGGSESSESSKALHQCFVQGLQKAELPEGAVQMIPTKDRAAVGEMLKADQYIDVIVPRGGKSLVGRVQQDARVPVFSHLDGINHQYVDKNADSNKAIEIIVNSKMRRTSVCGATECVLVHKDALAVIEKIIPALQDKGCTIHGDETVQALGTNIVPATDADWGHEYLSADIAIKVVNSIEGAMNHIAQYGSGHTDAIISEDTDAVERFQNNVDSAIVLANASTQFADGGEFGMGAEIGIATGKMHARGPVGVEELTTFKTIGGSVNTDRAATRP